MFDGHMDFSKIQLWSDLVGCICGIFTTSFLVLAIFRATDNKFRSYSHLILISAIFDLLLLTIQAFTQYQVMFTNGVVFCISPNPIYHFVSEGFGPILMFFHVFMTHYGLSILAVQSHYRYFLLKHGNPQLTLLIRNIVLTATLGLLQTSLVYIGEIKTAERGRDYYLRIIEKTPYYERLSKESFHVVDRNDIEVTAFIGFSMSTNLLNYTISIVYAFKSWKIIHPVKSFNNKTRQQQRQFSINLLIQLLNTTVFSLIPMSIPYIPFMTSSDSALMGFFVMFLFSWLPAANSTVSLLIIAGYRKYLRSFFFEWKRTATSTTPIVPFTRQSLK